MFLPKEEVGQSKPAAVASEVRHVERRVVRVSKVKAYAPEAKIKLALPETVIADQQEHVISTARVPDTNRPHTVTTTINSETGEAQSFVRADPLPWVALENRGELSLSVGYKYRDQVRPVVRLGVRQDFLQVKALHAGVVASIDSDGAAYAGVGVAYRW